MTLKTSFTFILLLVGLTAFNQGFEESKVINSEVELKEYEPNSYHNYIRYYPLDNGYLIRFENLKIQLYDKSLNEVWNYKFDYLFGMAKYNNFSLTWNDEFIFIMQETPYTYISGQGNESAILFRFNYVEGYVKEVVFSDLEMIQNTNKMEIIDGVLYVVWERLPASSVAKQLGSGTMNEYHTHITSLDVSLNKLFSYELPFHIQKAEFNAGWNFDGMVDQRFSFRRFFYQKENGEYTNDMYCACEPITEYIEVNGDFEIEEYEMRSTTNLDLTEHYSGVNYRYDTTHFKLLFNDKELHSGDLSIRFIAPPKGELDNLVLSNGNKHSVNLLEVYRSRFKIAKDHSSFLINYVISDPINDNVVIIASPVHYAHDFYFTFNNDLEIVSIHYVRDIDLEQYETSDARNVLAFRTKKIYEKFTYNNEHKMNAFDYGLENFNKKLCTVINYDLYQYLIVDDLKAKTSTVFKFVR